MIIVNLKGGLGNQMFQYACGRAISLKCGDDLKLDDYYISGDSLRKYGLDVFDIKAEIGTKDEIKKVKYPFGVISMGWRFFSGRILKKFRTVKFDPLVLKCRKNYFLDGYFQTEKYFIDYEEEIRNDFTLKVDLSENAEKIKESILSEKNSVSVHFRRTDYVNNPAHDIKDNDYQKKAIEEVKKRINPSKFYIFSDDINWVKENVKLPENSVFVSSPKIKDYEEMFLMGQCDHNIIANSSFSWWGAWLNNNPEKIVICPQKWVLQEEYRFSDTVPESWIRV